MAKKKHAKPSREGAEHSAPTPSSTSRAGSSSRKRSPSKRPARVEGPAARTPDQKVTVDLGILGALSGKARSVSRELCQLAAEESNKRRAEQLLKQAEELHPGSVLVPLLRGDMSGRPDLAMRQYRKALERATTNWDESRGKGRPRSGMEIASQDLETAHRAMASALEALRRPTEAIAHYAAILELVPGDDTAIEALALALLSAGQFADAAEVIARSDHPSYFTKALVEFCLRGATPLAATFLKKGHSENPHVVLLLLGDEQFDDALPENLSTGSSGAAQLYLLRAMPLWRDTPGAITWLRQVLGKDLTARKPTLKERRNQAHGLLKEIEQVPRLDTTPWRLSVRALHAEDRSRGAAGGSGNGGQLAVLTNEPGDKLYHSTVFDDVPNTEMMLELLLDASEELKTRPSTVLFDDPRLLRRIETTLESSGIRARLVDRNRALDDSIDDLREQVVQSLDHGDPVSGEELERIPPSSDIWLVDSQRLPRWVENKDNRFVRLQSVMVVSQSLGAIISQRVEAAEEDLPEVVWQTVSHAMTHPFVGPAQRPAEIRVRTHDLRVSLEARLRPLAVRCVVSGDFKMFDEAHALLVKSLAEDPDDQDEYSLVKGGHTLESVEALYRAASRFYRSAPWKSVPAEFGVEVQAKGWKKPRYAVVIGQSGLLQGLCVYDSEEDFLRSMAVDTELDDVSAINLFFDEPQALPIADHDACLDHNWPVASPEGFPVVIRVRRRRKPGPPTPEELRILTALVEVLPDFFAGRKPVTELDSLLGPLKLTLGKAKLARTAPRKRSSPTKKRPPKK